MMLPHTWYSSIQNEENMYLREGVFCINALILVDATVGVGDMFDAFVRFDCYARCVSLCLTIAANVIAREFICQVSFGFFSGYVDRQRSHAFARYGE